MKAFNLKISWAVSRGANTEDWDICRLDAPAFPPLTATPVPYTVKRYRTTGAGYDLVGTVLAEWLADQYATRLATLRPRAYRDGSRCSALATGLYGLVINSRGKPYIDGACGVHAVMRIAEAMGITLHENYLKPRNARSPRADGFLVIDYGSAEALKAALKPAK